MSDETYVFEIDPDEMSMAEFEEFAELTGRELEDVLEPRQVFESDGSKMLDEDGRPVKRIRITSKARTVLLYLYHKRSNPDFTLEDAGRIKLGQIVVPDRSDDDEEAKGNE